MTTDLAEQMASELGEMMDEPRQKIAHIVQRCGPVFAREVFDETQRIESQGGMMVRDGSRRRTPGGVFFFLVAERLRRERRFDDLDALYPRDTPRSSKKTSSPPPMPSSRTAPPVVPKVKPRKKSVVAPREEPSHRTEQPDTADAIQRVTMARVVQSLERPNQSRLLAIVEKHLGRPSDLYKRSVNPDTGDITLSFRFPEIARQRYVEELAEASNEAGVAVTISPHPHQGALIGVALSLVPPGLSTLRTPSLLFDPRVVRMECHGTTTEEEIASAQERFRETTGWSLQIVLSDEEPRQGSGSSSVPDEAVPLLDQNTALSLVRAAFHEDCYKVSADRLSHTLTVRFFFPERARQTYAETLTSLESQTGWKLEVYPQAHQEKLLQVATEVLPSSLAVAGTPSLYQSRQAVVVRYHGQASDEERTQAKHTFHELTGWNLELLSA